MKIHKEENHRSLILPVTLILTAAFLASVIDYHTEGNGISGAVIAQAIEDNDLPMRQRIAVDNDVGQITLYDDTAEKFCMFHGYQYAVSTAENYIECSN